MVQLDENFEQVILNFILDKRTISLIPEDLYKKFYIFLVQEERFEDLQILVSYKEKVVPQTLEELLNNKEYERNYF